MTRILGITDGDDAGATIVADGRLVAAVGEERLNRLKMTIGFPRRSIPECLRLAGLEPGDIDAVAVASLTEVNHPEPIANDGWYEEAGGVRRVRNAVAGALSGPLGGLPIARSAYRKLKHWSMGPRRQTVERLVRELGITAPISYLDHHRCHAVAAHDASGFERSLSISLDGGGDGLCCRVLVMGPDEERELCRLDALDSIGNFYAYVTHLCGYKASIHEGKITGLAAHGTPRYLDMFRRMIDEQDGRIVNRSRLFFGAALRAMQRELGPTWKHEDLAASIQQHLEAVVVRFVRHWVRESGCSLVSLSGGVFANVLLNQRIADLPEVEGIFVFPAMGDGGLGAGAAICASRDAGRRIDPIEHVYLGSGFDDASITAAVAAAGLTAERCDDMEQRVARLLADGRVVAHCNGPMEFGPRALGNRTLMYRTDDPTVNEWLNNHLHRTEFMPFAPAIPAGEEARCFRWNPASERAARFMTVTMDCTDWMKKHCPGVVHIDGTARPQIVDEETNPRFHGILRAFEAITGVPVLINTSFNIHGEPIVASAEDAIRSFMEGHLDYLVLGDWLIEGEHDARTVARPTAVTADVPAS